MAVQPYIALTDKDWFDFLTSISTNGRLDEVNFWSPKSDRPMKKMRVGEPVFFRLKRPHYVIAGYGFFAHFSVLELDRAWETFGDKNGDPDKLHFLKRIGEYRGTTMLDPATKRAPLGCTLLRDAVFWPSKRWIPWGEAEGWHKNSVRGQPEPDPVRASRLLSEIAFDHVDEPPEFTAEFDPLEADERQFALAATCRREGQGTFRSRLVDAYGRCAISGERTEPVLDAAHVQPYLGPRSNHIQNGILLSKDLHALFDRGLITVTPEYRVRVSQQIRERWKNGKRYYEFNDRELVALPRSKSDHPSARALRWHNERFTP